MNGCIGIILAEGAMTLPVTLSRGVLFASWKLLQFPDWTRVGSENDVRMMRE